MPKIASKRGSVGCDGVTTLARLPVDRVFETRLSFLAGELSGVDLLSFMLGWFG